MTRCFRVVDLRVSIFIFLVLFSISFPCSFQWFVCNERVYSSNANLRYLREGGPRCVRLEFYDLGLLETGTEYYRQQASI